MDIDTFFDVLEISLGEDNNKPKMATQSDIDSFF